jgi:hypothetical protein
MALKGQNLRVLWIDGSVENFSDCLVEIRTYQQAGHICVNMETFIPFSQVRKFIITSAEEIPKPASG